MEKNSDKLDRSVQQNSFPKCSSLPKYHSLFNLSIVLYGRWLLLRVTKKICFSRKLLAENTDNPSGRPVSWIPLKWYPFTRCPLSKKQKKKISTFLRNRSSQKETNKRLYMLCFRMHVMHCVAIIRSSHWLTNLCSNQGNLFKNALHCVKCMRICDVVELRPISH